MLLMGGGVSNTLRPSSDVAVARHVWMRLSTAVKMENPVHTRLCVSSDAYLDATNGREIGITKKDGKDCEEWHFMTRVMRAMYKVSF